MPQGQPELLQTLESSRTIILGLSTVAQGSKGLNEHRGSAEPEEYHQPTENMHTESSLSSGFLLITAFGFTLPLLLGTYMLPESGFIPLLYFVLVNPKSISVFGPFGLNIYCDIWIGREGTFDEVLTLRILELRICMVKPMKTGSCC